jgi:hypothetical protein
VCGLNKQTIFLVGKPSGQEKWVTQFPIPSEPIYHSRHCIFLLSPTFGVSDHQWSSRVSYWYGSSPICILSGTFWGCGVGLYIDQCLENNGFSGNKLTRIRIFVALPCCCKLHGGDVMWNGMSLEGSILRHARVSIQQVVI